MKKILVTILILVAGAVSEAGKGNEKTPPGQAKKEPVVMEPSIMEEGVEESEEAGDSDGRITYILVPKDGEKLYIIGMDSRGTKYGYGLSEDEEVNNFPVENLGINEKDYYGDVKLLEVSLESDKDVKLIAGYKLPGEDKYVLLSSDNLDDDMLKGNYINGDGLRIIKLEDYTEYSKFPGYEAEEAVMTGIRVGEEEVGKSSGPSNIIKKFGADTTGGGEGLNILPSNSHTEFYMESKEKDSKGNNIVYVFKKMGSGNNADPDYYEQINKGDNLENKKVTKVVITPKGGKDQYLAIGEKRYTLKHNVTYIFTSPDPEGFEVSLTNEGEGSGQWYFEYISGEVGISPNSGVTEVEEVYVIGSKGLQYEGSVKIKAGEYNKKSRTSNIDINVLENVKTRFQIKNIEE